MKRSGIRALKPVAAWAAMTITAAVLATGFSLTLHHPMAIGPTADGILASADSVEEMRAGAGRLTYEADILNGRIGRLIPGEPDMAHDNVFIVRIPEAPKGTDLVFLEYTLSGAADHDAIARGINAGRAIGGLQMRARAGTSLQRERVLPGLIQAGRNEIRFSAHEPSLMCYLVQNVRVVVEPTNASWVDEIVITNASDSVFGGLRYVKGFVHGPNVDGALLEVGGVTVNVDEGAFEALVHVGARKDLEKFTIRARLLNGSVISKEVASRKSRREVMSLTAPEEVGMVSQVMTGDDAFKLHGPHGALLEAPKGSVGSPTPITIKELRKVDLPPMPPDLVNVTPAAGGFRYLPDGVVFNNAVQIGLPIDTGLIPEGYTVADVRTYFFDPVRRDWSRVQRDSLLTGVTVLRSFTDHFTDYINGIIKVPESPETMGYQPTSIKDLKVGDATAGIALMAPPEATHTGTMSTRFPIKVPPGRQGMQPELALVYNSEGGHSWCGLGWNLTGVSSISVDTRWGVPHFSLDKESETYLLDGEMLSGVGHRGWDTARYASGAVRFFHARAEGGFRRIARKGNGPEDYYWEVTTKDGTIHYYGRVPGSPSISEAVLREGNDGPVARWCIVRSRDTNGNTIDYEYDSVVRNTAPAQGGKQLYIRRIIYTGHQSPGANAQGRFMVEFLRAAQERPDVSINARNGFLEVTAHRLERVVVKYDEEVVRTYVLSYVMGPFLKSLLKRVAEYDGQSVEFYRHEYEYFDEVGDIENDPAPYSDTVAIWEADGQDEGLSGYLLPGLGPLVRDGPTAISGSWSASESFGGSVTVGPPGSVYSKMVSVGGNYHHSRSKGYGILSLMDVNGDNIPDRLFQDPDGLTRKIWYRPGFLGVSGGQFGAAVPIDSSRYFQRSMTRGHQGGFEAHPPYAFAGVSASGSTTTTKDYMLDRNGDGLPDLVSQGRVWFNRLELGQPAFHPSSEETENPVDGGPVHPDIEEMDPELIQVLREENPLHDVVRVWTAPYQGHVTISGTVQLLLDASEEAADDLDRDGVHVWVQRGSNDVLWDTSILENDFDAHSFLLTNELVQPGDRIYFRVGSNDHGQYDQVRWNPLVVEYTSTDYPDDVTDFPMDANGKNLARFSAPEDFLLTGRQALFTPELGNITIDGTFTCPELTDEVLVRVRATDDVGSVVYPIEHVIPAFTDTVLATPFTGSFGPMTELEFEVTSTSNVDWQAIAWSPTVSMGDTNGNGLFQPVVSYGMFNRVLVRSIPLTGAIQSFPERRFVVEDTVTIRLTPNPALFASANVPGTGMVHFTAKVLGSDTVGRASWSFVGNNLQALGSTMVEVTAFPFDALVVEYHVDNALLADSLAFSLDVEVIDTFAQWTHPSTVGALEGNIEDRVGIHTALYDSTLIFGPQYRTWGQFAYRANGDGQNDPIDENVLVLDDTQMNADGGLLGSVSADEPGATLNSVNLGNYDPSKAKFIYMAPRIASGSYMGFDDLTYVKADTLSSSRFGEDNLFFALSPTPDSLEARVPAKRTVSGSDALSASVTSGDASQWISGSLGYGHTDGYERTEVDVLDLNGDRYPDNVRDTLVQYTDPSGKLLPLVVHAIDSLIHASTSSGNGFTASGSFPSLISKSKPRETAAIAAGKSASAALGGSIGGGVNSSGDAVQITWLDINGDGLPDQVRSDDSVRLNLGYRFAPPERWNYQDVRKSSSAQLSIDVGAAAQFALSRDNGSISLGLGATRADNYSIKAFQDVNGDGLPDQIGTSNGQIVSVRLNTGDGFVTIPWEMGGSSLDKGYGDGTATNFAFTVCFNLFLARICVNPSASISHGVSGQSTRFTDMNGDGYVDFIESDGYDALAVRYSTIGRTNLLKRVKGPLNGSFEVSYKLVGNTYDLPQGKWVMDSLTVLDGTQDIANIGRPPMLRTFDYLNGKYSRREREFYGFQTVVVREHDTQAPDAPVYRQTIRTHDVAGYYTKGLLHSTELRDADGQLWKRTEHDYVLRGAGGNQLPSSFNTTNDRGWAFPALERTEETSYEPPLGEALQRTYSFAYDALGNVTSYTDATNGGSSTVETSIEYHPPGSSYIADTPRLIQVTADSLRRHREQDRDAQGNITAIRQFINDSEFALFRFTYDDFGNLLSMTRPPNHAGDSLRYAYTYDADVKTYVNRVEDSYGYVSRSGHDPRFGALLWTEDLNLQRTVYQLDLRGRVVKVTGPLENPDDPAAYTIKVDYSTNANWPRAKVTHFNEDHPDQGIETITYVDGLGKPLQVKKTGRRTIVNGTSELVLDVYLVSPGQVFDAFGRTVREYLPIGVSPDEAVPYTGVQADTLATSRAYDVLDRQRWVALPLGDTTHFEYRNQDFDGVRCAVETVTDALDHYKRSLKDERGNEVARIDQGPEGEITTRFKHNGIGELLRVVDHEQNETTYGYDRLGRKLRYQHPDGGLTEFVYDKAGNLTHKLTANLRELFGDTSGAIKYTYEYERLRRIDYPNNFQNQVVYEYGAPGASHKRAGRIWRQLDASGGQEFFYGPMGEVVKNIRTVVISQAQIHTYVWQQRYDSWNRIQEMWYPDGERVEYGYNQAGMLQQVFGEKLGQRYDIIKYIGYDEFEQRVLLKHGNDAITRYAYEPGRRRLSNLTVRVPQGNRMVMNLSYAYDGVNNITGLVNDVQPHPEHFGGNMTSSFQYDVLDRLVHAEGSYAGQVRADAYALDMTYDDLHNIRAKQQTHTSNVPATTLLSHNLEYTYMGRPHTPERVGNRRYAYDANGNLTGWRQEDQTQRNREMHWDEENRLKGLADDGYMNLYTYDAAGERVLKSHGGMQAVEVNGAPVGLINHTRNWSMYVSPYMVVTDRGFTKHYYVEGQRVASRIGSGRFLFGMESLPTLMAGGWDYRARIDSMQQQLNAQQASQGPWHPSLVNPASTSVFGPVATTPSYPAGQGWPSGFQQTAPSHPGTTPPTGQPVTSDNAQAGYGYPAGGNESELNRYFYHPDHLGSATYITDHLGMLRQHIEYTAFGENFVEEHTSTDTQPYLYNGKELDSETGLYYYGARYYDPMVSMWASVDPMADSLLSHSPFNFVRHSPLIRIDPDGARDRYTEKIVQQSKQSQREAVQTWNGSGKLISGYSHLTGSDYRASGMAGVTSGGFKSPQASTSAFDLLTQAVDYMSLLIDINSTTEYIGAVRQEALKIGSGKSGLYLSRWNEYARGKEKFLGIVPMGSYIDAPNVHYRPLLIEGANIDEMMPSMPINPTLLRDIDKLINTYDPLAPCKVDW